jgi:hypothetical protein
MRAELGRPGLQFLSPEQYDQLLTMHGSIMLLLFATPLVFAFANLVLPLQIGAPDFGWYAYAPLSTGAHTPGSGANLWISGLVVAGVGTILGAVNMLTTIVCLRAPGMTMFRMPIFTWSIFVTSLLILVAFPTLTYNAWHSWRYGRLALRDDPWGPRQLAGVGDVLAAAAAQLRAAAPDPLRAPGLRAALPAPEGAPGGRGPCRPAARGRARVPRTPTPPETPAAAARLSR